MVKANATGKFCVYTLCASRPCHRGTCVAQSPSKFTCECPEGYRGRHCEVALAIYQDDVGLSFTSLFAICICFMALLGSYVHHVLFQLFQTLLNFTLPLKREKDRELQSARFSCLFCLVSLPFFLNLLNRYIFHNV